MVMRYYANKIEIPLEQIAYLDMIMPRSIQSSGTNSQEYNPSNGHPTIIVKIRDGHTIFSFLEFCPGQNGRAFVDHIPPTSLIELHF